MNYSEKGYWPKICISLRFSTYSAWFTEARAATEVSMTLSSLLIVGFLILGLVVVPDSTFKKPETFSR
jgi:hypothetical protein